MASNLDTNATQNPNAEPMPSDISGAYRMLAEGFELMRMDGSGEGVLDGMIEELVRGSEAPPRKVEGVGQEFLDGECLLVPGFELGACVQWKSGAFGNGWSACDERVFVENARSLVGTKAIRTRALDCGDVADQRLWFDCRAGTSTAEGIEERHGLSHLQQSVHRRYSTPFPLPPSHLQAPLPSTISLSPTQILPHRSIPARGPATLQSEAHVRPRVYSTLAEAACHLPDRSEEPGQGEEATHATAEEGRQRGRG